MSEEEFETLAYNAPSFKLPSMDENDIQQILKGTERFISELNNQFEQNNPHFLIISRIKQCTVAANRLKIAVGIRNLFNNIKKFDIYYNKLITEPKIIDITIFIQTFYQITDALKRYSNLTICKGLDKSIYDKFQKTNEGIRTAIYKIGYQNLSLCDIFLLILISSSTQQFWGFFNFLRDDILFKQFKKANLSDFIIDCKNIFSFYNKISNISPLLRQANLKEYVDSDKKQKVQLENEILAEIAVEISIINLNQSLEKIVDNIKSKVTKFLTLGELECCFIDFKSKLKESISKGLIKFVNHLVNIDNSAIENMQNINNLLVQINNLFDDVSFDQNILNTDCNFGNLYSILNTRFLSIYPPSSSSLNQISTNAFILFDVITKKPNCIFNQFFLNMIKLYLNSLIFVIMMKFSEENYIAQIEKRFYVASGYKRKLSDKVPQYIEQYLSLEEHQIQKLFISIYNLVDPILKHQHFCDYKKFIDDFYLLCPRIFYNFEDKKCLINQKLIDHFKTIYSELDAEIITEKAKNDKKLKRK